MYVPIYMQVCLSILSDLLKHHVLLIGLSSVDAVFAWIIRRSTHDFLHLLRECLSGVLYLIGKIHQCTLVCLNMLVLIGISSGVCGSWLDKRVSRSEGGEMSERNKQVMMGL